MSIALPFLLLVQARASESEFSQRITPFLQEYCFDCHGDGMNKGDMSFDAWKDARAALEDRATWERVLRMVEFGEMPPKKKKQPSAEERERLLGWIETAVLKLDCANPDPGRVTIRRLNRAEYNNTIRDLLGVDSKPAEDFPVDDSGYGFDNIGDALSMPPILLEKYLAAARRIVEAALGPRGEVVSQTNRYAVDLLEVGYNAKQRGDGWVALNSIEEDDVAVSLDLPYDAEYLMRVHAYARQDGPSSMKLTFMLDGKPVEMVAVETNAAAKVYATRVVAPAGKHRFRAVVRRIKDGLPEAEALKWKSGPEQKGAVFIEWMELEGPLQRAASAPKLVLPAAAPGNEKRVAREFLAELAGRAYRRPITKQELDRLAQLAESARSAGGDFREGIATALQAMLVSPHFLFRGELQPEPDNPKSVHAVNEYALASRLSYFLWSTMPDEELFRETERKTLRKNLEKQVRRMLADPKSRALVDNFAGQWLQLRNLSTLTPDKETFPKFDEPLREAMHRETEMFFETVLREDRSVLDFLDGDYTFVNARLAKHYGIEGVEGGDFRRVSLAGTNRRGVLTHGSILLLTSNPTRTSLVKRGKWVLDNFLNAPPPPPPPGTPELKEEKELTGTLRQRLEQHRADTLCASCHARMDPIGFALEHFDAIGAWRDVEGNSPIDAAGELTTGEKFTGPLELVSVLSNHKREQFLRCFVEKLLTYALGRGIEPYDRCAVKQIVANAAREDYRFSAILIEIIKSAPFQKRRGDPDPES